MTDNEREEWVYDLAVAWVNRLSDAGIWAMAVDRAISILEPQTNAQLEAFEKEQPIKQMHGFKKKDGGFGFK